MGITDCPELQVPLFALFLIIYLISLLGNLGMILLTMVDSRLQTPMYFFLKHLAITDLGYSIAVEPKMLENFVVTQNTISYYLCAAQLACFLLFITCELFILSAMSYDRFVAICNPLLYPAIMSQRACWVLAAIPYLYGLFLSLIITLKMFHFINLWLQCNQSLFLWLYSFDIFALFNHSWPWGDNSNLCHFWFYFFTSSCSWVLPANPHSHSQNELCWGKAQGFCNLWITPDCGHRLLWDFDIYVFAAKL